ncbi:unnamed protein product [Rotaria socialis]|uniref:Major facilitator superfamily (MFS) profile domain-containing protein n=1 Tax=Rotaria socialis TaxID=392032 RepID=A0A817ZK04_9BILA|nr:unnamed protein product [Rotaria socialis]CAF3392513.1 unnamed protein product [Rotaria socialis]CAF3490873.1 unnamed protein product [Rotaria socialis]CAF3498944.1 unnamed protein product [Rotaria socialis]CAF4528277.1 unnamed protein product [Rotaria socialis]
MGNQGPFDMVIQEEEIIRYQRAVSRLICKLDRRLIPFLALLEIARFGFQVAIGLILILVEHFSKKEFQMLTGHALLTTFKVDLDLTNEENNWTTSAFFIAYLIFAIPSSLILRLLGTTRYLSLSLISWGAITIGMAFVTNARQVIILRFFLGMVIAGYFPGIITYFSLWYPKREQIMRIAIFCTATFASGALVGILAYASSKMNGIANLKSWQWLFLLPGLPVIPIGIMTYLALGSIPETVQWLDNCEKQFLTNLLRQDSGVANSERASDSLLSWRQVWYVFVDWRMYLYATIIIGDLGGIKCLMTSLPSIMKGLHYSIEEAHLMTIIPYVISCFTILLGGYSSSRRNEHAYHHVFFLCLGLLGFILMITLEERGKLVMYVSVCIACCGTFSALSILWSWLTNNVGGNTKRTVAVGMMSGIGQIGAIIQPQVFSGEDKPVSRRDHIIASGFLVGALIMTLILRYCLMMENRRRQYLSDDDYNREAAIEEPCDWVNIEDIFT